MSLPLLCRLASACLPAHLDIVVVAFPQGAVFSLARHIEHFKLDATLFKRIASAPHRRVDLVRVLARRLERVDYCALPTVVQAHDAYFHPFLDLL